MAQSFLRIPFTDGIATAFKYSKKSFSNSAKYMVQNILVTNVTNGAEHIV
jgi:hypothetical protein